MTAEEKRALKVIIDDLKEKIKAVEKVNEEMTKKFDQLEERFNHLRRTVVTGHEGEE